MNKTKEKKKENKLKEIISYAVERGWDVKVAKYHIDYLSLEQPLTKAMYYDILFSHDFAKAVFGEKEIEIHGCPACEINTNEKENEVSWIHHLQQAVLSKDPIEYYYKFITQRK